MRLWRFRDPIDDFARASHVNAWDDCAGPSRDAKKRTLQIVWEPGSTKVGDFTWPGTYTYLAKRTVAEELLAAGWKGFEPAPVEMLPNPDHRRRKPRNMIQLPYEGPEIVELYVVKWVGLNHECSTFRIEGKDEYGESIYELEGLEHIEHGDWDRETGVLERIRVPRTPGMGAYIDIEQLGDCDIFRIDEVPGMIVCTDRFRDFVLEKGYTNIDFFEVGEVIE